MRNFNYSIFLLLFHFLIGSFFTLTAQNTNPDWWKNTTIYQIYPRSFQDSDGDGIGDINGIISRLDHIKSLGIETIWVSPFFTSPLEDWGYDVSDYKGVAAEYGDLNSVDRLITEVHNRGMKILFDMVLNHTSDKHPWFKESSSSKDNPKRDWYIWNEKEPNNWKNQITGSAWNKSAPTGEYYFSAFLPFQPDLNLRNPAVKEALKDAMRYWLDRGIDGFRFDLFTFLYEDIELRNNPFELVIAPPPGEPEKYFFQNHIYNMNREEVIPFSQEIRKVLDEYPGTIGLTEAIASLDFLKRIQTGDDGNGPGVHQTMLLDFLGDFKFTKRYFETSLMKYIAAFGSDTSIANMTHTSGNHDRKRAMDLVGRGEDEKAKMMALFQFTASGNALMFQGEEIGMTLGQIPAMFSKDPTAQGPFFNLQTTIVELFESITGGGARILNRDNTRIPMQWDDNKKNAGFSTADETWLPMYGIQKSLFAPGSWFSSANRVNVADQENKENSMLNAYKQIISLRNTNETIKKGAIKLHNLKDDFLDYHVLVYERYSGEEKILFLLNFWETDLVVPIDNTKIETVLFETKKGETKINSGSISIPSHSGVVLKIKKQTTSDETIPKVEVIIESPGAEDVTTIEPPVDLPDFNKPSKDKGTKNPNSLVILWPIPAEDVLVITATEDKAFISSVTVYDLNNKKISANSFSGLNNIESINVSGINSGMYAVLITHADGRTSSNLFLKK